MKTSLSESEAKRKNKPITILDFEPCDWLVLPLLLPTPIICFHWIIRDGVTSGIGRKWKRSDSSDFRLPTSDFVELMTPLMTPFFRFSLGHKRSYVSDYDSDSDSVASENQPLELITLESTTIAM